MAAFAHACDDDAALGIADFRNRFFERFGEIGFQGGFKRCEARLFRSDRPQG